LAANVAVAMTPPAQHAWNNDIQIASAADAASGDVSPFDAAPALPRERTSESEPSKNPASGEGSQRLPSDRGSDTKEATWGNVEDDAAVAPVAPSEMTLSALAAGSAPGLLQAGALERIADVAFDQFLAGELLSDDWSASWNFDLVALGVALA